MTTAALAPSTERSSLASGLRALAQNAVDYSAARTSRALERVSSRLEDTVAGKAGHKVEDVVDNVVDKAEHKFEDVVGDVVDKAEHKVEDVVEDVVEDHGVATGAVVGGVDAAVHHKNPVWGAFKGMWSGTQTSTKVLVVAGIVLALLLGPVALVLLLLALLVTMIVLAVRRSKG